jgi:threonine/homoserine/homoserine lactone efflux protein
MPIDPDRLVIFLAAGLALNFTPGADMLYCLGQGLKGGPRAGIAASLGIATGSLIHTLLGAFGLAALIATQPAAFEAMRWAGVAYLVWLGIAAFRAPPRAVAAASGGGRRSAVAAWRDGALVNLLNPKVIVFTLAFLPQFIDPARGSPLVQFLILGAIFNVTGTMVNTAVGGFAGSLGRALAGSARLARGLNWMSGCLFLGLAARLALDRR